MRPRISRAARFVNVNARMACAGVPRSSSRAKRPVRTRVLPEPAPAITSAGPSPCSTAASWASLNDDSAKETPIAGFGCGPSNLAQLRGPSLPALRLTQLAGLLRKPRRLSAREHDPPRLIAAVGSYADEVEAALGVGAVVGRAVP